jgi:tRNA A-37 threonylcarbamoyl transferase component Bud32
MSKITEIPSRIIKLLQTELGSEKAPLEYLKVLQLGNYGNANVYRVSGGAEDLVVKEFYSRSWFVRTTLGRLYIHRELKIMKHLKGIPGIPAEVRRLGAYALFYSFIPGETLSSIKKKRKAQLPSEFFIKLESQLKQMHQAGIAHLDVRNLGNVIHGKDGVPYLIDYQSSVGTGRLPKRIRRIMEDADFSGIYKGWEKLCEVPLDADREAFLEMVNRRRKLWFFKGYALDKATKRGKKMMRSKLQTVLKKHFSQTIR